MGIFDKMKEPVFLKESTSLQEQLAQLEALQTTDSLLQKQIQKDIKLLKYGIAGEEKIAFELKNSHMPMFVLHDLYIEYNGLSAQIDYLIVTKGKAFLVECKNLYGNIEINNNGDFIRTMKYGAHFEKEGIYSPITQNLRHLELLKAIRRDQPLNFLQKLIFEKSFSELYCPVVVLANPQTVLYAKYAKKEVKEQVIRADQLIAYIRKKNENALTCNEIEMREWAESLLALHKDRKLDYTETYRKAIAEKQETAAMEESAKQQAIICPKCGAVMVKRRAAKGPYAGNEFWGCSNYPNCKCIINIDTKR
ncbi:MAG: NERD domain-containing protein [Peptococcaceae bacterium]|nr:NERD domain-containing protein [Peptococcaceae bacterium]